MSANYLYKKEDGVLQHGHPQASRPYTIQFHPAHTIHRVDPGLHDKHSVWTETTWSPQNSLGAPGGLTDSQKRHLVNLARKAHNEVFNPNYRKAAEAPHDEQVIQMQPTPAQPAPTPISPPTPVQVERTPAADGEVDLSFLEERITNLEDMAINTLEPLDRRLAGIDQTLSAQSKTLVDFRTDISELEANLADINVDKQLAPLTARVLQLEEAARRQITYVVKSDQAERKLESIQHVKFDQLIKLATNLSPNRRNIWIAGPAGGGKTTAAEKLAELLGLPFEYSGAIFSPYELSGVKYANGEYGNTAFRRRYEEGGVILLDEVDGSDPRALLVINAALANSSASFPDGMVKRHPDCVVICAANTWGFGGDSNYVGRVKLDAAFLNRFAKIRWDYDEVLERQAAIGPHDWVDAVQATRKLVFAHKAQFVVSPRSSIFGCELLRNGMTANEVADAMFGDYRVQDQWTEVGKPIEDFVKHYEEQAANELKRRLNEKSDLTEQFIEMLEAKSPLDSVDFSQVRS